MILTKSILILATLLILSQGQTLNIVAPYDALNSEFSRYDNTFNFTVGNFGFNPWGKRIVAPIVLPQAGNEDGCKTIDHFHSGDYQGESLPIVLIKRGNCKFTQKARNVQDAGGRVAVIYDNIHETTYITMKDDGSGDSVVIPSVFITIENGEGLARLIKKTQSGGDHLMISLSFAIEQTKTVDVGFYINLPDENALFFLQSFRQLYSYFDSDVVNFYPIYQYIQGYEGNNGYSKPRDNCLGGGRYCCYDPDGPGTATGKMIAEEQLRQICVFRALGIDNWFAYMDRFAEQEARVQAYGAVHEKMMKHLKLSSKQQKAFDECFDGSFTNESNHDLGENSILDEQLEIIEYSGVHTWPAVHINNITYKGRYASYPVEEAICGAMLEKNERCKFVMDPTNYQQPSHASTWGIIGIILTILFIIFAVILFVYKKYIKREMKHEMKGQVNEMVSNYVKFYEAKQKDTEN